ncbi:MAG: glucosamine-6-phosphate deaminase [Dysgonamonadaceae bacterium]|jgi:glucosamine-6-phosphate deaminase|nr:glucosamine-6-phosphate deaminase [Dysgonamonadaceae bacterium]MDD3308601.1 glucosamine-6-phosphate deaminase [Dysgonamonadaceae bacterium]MDD3900729.1 glucosamine-6-phosphate deaminase [Dysgonamonadaceae bacterium]MDD4400043.1 glucosamine-6-phosphate deaminase [Dysgonamonadaceae bacterium]
MRLDLSSNITFERVPQKLYRPENDFEEYSLTRFEKVPTLIYENISRASRKVASEIVKELKKKQQKGEQFVLGLSDGSSPVSVYEELIRLHKEEGVSFSNLVVFNTYEFYPIVDVTSCIQSIKEVFLNHIDIDPANIYSLDATVEKDLIGDKCEEYEQKLHELGGLDFLLVGLGSKGNVALNMPGSNRNSNTRLVLLDGDSRKDAISIFGTLDKVPPSALTMGLSDMLEAKKIILVAWGEEKAESIKAMVEGAITETVPASLLQTHENVAAVIDISAGEDLTRISTPWLVTNCEWTNKLIRRAIVWLCNIVEKPILKLTNKDYQDNSLSELLTLFGSAYNVNIKVFNELQHTITGWPGGKPDADDTYRPERAKPFPKKVIVFSPHPDDDVISMGGTFQRLINQGHQVHVAYETSGNIAVGDEEVIRYLSVMNHMCERFGADNQDMVEQNNKMLNFLLHEKTKDDIDTPDILYLKGRIRREEATTADRYMGVPDSNIHFLDLPFYETGRVKKNPISEKDVEIVRDFIESVKPHQMYVAGDLADPHGTHKVALNAVLAAVDLLKDEEWFKDCRIWMYRGAWMEWEIDHIEMAVPLSPEELRQKRNSILKHQSQMESAPFLGDDERLFWQRSEERNKATAEMYWKLGLASYEAIEAFVEYVPIK